VRAHWLLVVDHTLSAHSVLDRLSMNGMHRLRRHVVDLNLERALANVVSFSDLRGLMDGLKHFSRMSSVN
jgi:hypothetical protein